MGVFRAVKVVYRQAFEHERPFEREFTGIRYFEPIFRSHKSQVDILRVGRKDGYYYYVMELADPAKNPNDEIRNPKEPRNPNAETDNAKDELRTSGFGLPSSFDIRHSDLYVPRTLKYDLQTRGAHSFRGMRPYSLRRGRMIPVSSTITRYPSRDFGSLRTNARFLRATITFRQGVLPSLSRATYTPTTPGIAINASSWSFNTALISRRANVCWCGVLGWGLE